MAGRNLGEAFVVISPDTGAFLSDLTTKVTAAVQAVRAPDVKVGAKIDGSGLPAQLLALTKGMQPLLDTLGRLKLDASTTAMQAKIAAVQAQVLALGKQMGAAADNLDAAQVARFQAGLLSASAAAEKLAGALWDTGPALGPVTQEMSLLQAQTEKLAATLAGLDVDFSDTAAVAKLTALQAQAAKLQDTLQHMGIDADPAGLTAVTAQASKLADDVAKFQATLAAPVPVPATAELAALQKQAAGLVTELGGIKIQADDLDMTAKLAALQAQAAKLQDTLADTSIGGDPVKMAAQAAAVSALAANTAKFGQAAADANARTSVWDAALGALAARFGPGAQGIGWTAAIGGVAGWHIVLDGVIEATIIATGATLALGAAFAGTYPAFDELGYHTMAALNVMTAYGADAGKLAGTLDTLQKSLAPQVIEAFGGALNLITGQTGALSTAAHEVVDMVDTWIAKLDLWANGQKTVGGLLQAGVGYLSQLGKAIGIVAQAIDNLLSKDPGIAHYLLDLIQGFAEVINLFSKLPAPVVEATLMLHGFYVWASVLGGVLGKLTGPLLSTGAALIKLAGMGTELEALQDVTGWAKVTAAVQLFGKALLALAASPWTWALLGVAAIGLMAYEATQADNSVKSLITTMNNQVATASASQAFKDLAADISTLQDKMSDTGALAQEEQENWGKLGNTFRSLGYDSEATLSSMSRGLEHLTSGDVLGGIRDLATGLRDAFDPGAGRGLAVQQDVAALNDEMNKLIGTQRNLYAETGNLMTGQNKLNVGTLSFTQSLTLMDMAGVQAGDSMAVMNQKIANLVAGYTEMSAGGTQLQASINAVTFSTETQDSKVTQLNTGWDDFFKLVSGGSSDFLSFAQQINGMNETFANMSGTGTTLSISNGKVSDSIKNAATAATGGKASMTGLNDASIAAQQTLLQTATAANTQMDSLTSLASAAGLGNKGLSLLQQATKDMLQQMLPAAQGSTQLTTVLYALAQRGGYAGADSFRALSDWVGKTRDPMANLQGIVTTLSVKAGNLTQDVQNLSVALGQNLTQAMASAVTIASGGQKAFDDFATAALSSHVSAGQLDATALELGQALYKITGNVNDAKTQFLAFAQGALHMTSQEANGLWSDIQGKLSQSISDLSTKVLPPAQQAFEKFAGKGGGSGLGLATAQADQLYQKMTGPLAAELTDLTKNKAPQAQAAFEKWAGRGGGSGLGLTQAQAQALWNFLQTSLGRELLDEADNSVPAVQKAFEKFAGLGGGSGLGLVQLQADQLWAKLTGSISPVLDLLANSKAPGAEQAFEKFAGRGGATGLGLTQAQAQALWTFLNSNLIPVLDGLTNSHVPNTQKAFEAWAGKNGASGLGLTISQADALYKKLVGSGGLQPAIDSLHGKNIDVTMKGTGSYTISEALSGISAAVAARSPTGTVGGSRFQHGGRLAGFGGGDRIHAMLEAGETVLPKEATRDPLTHVVAAKYHVPGFQMPHGHAGLALAAGATGVQQPDGATLGLPPGIDISYPPGGRHLPGFQAGGVVGQATPAADAYSGNLTPAAIDTMMSTFTDTFGNALVGSMQKSLKTAEQQAAAGGSGVLAYAESFEGKVPYVWGGDTPAGWDCSGFVSYVYEHFGLLAERMVAAGLQSWATESKSPVPGGMAFYGNPAYHVGFVVDANTLLSALGHAYGTTYSALGMSGLAGYGIPPHGFGAGGGGGGGGEGSTGYWQNVGREMAAQYGWTGPEYDALNSLWTKESGWNPDAVNPSSGAAGIPQDISGNMHGGGVGQIAWGLAYIATRYGDPIAAWAHEVADNWYRRGGVAGLQAGGIVGLYDTGGVLPPGLSLAYNGTGASETVIPMTPEAARGYAVGGVVTAYHNQLTAEQGTERKDYASFVAAATDALRGAKSGSYESSHRKSILDEMATLAKRQAAEDLAYMALRGAGFTVSDLSKLATKANDAITTTKDVALSHLPGGTLGALRSELAAVAHLAAHPPSLLGAAGPGVETLYPTWPTPSGQVDLPTFWLWLPRLESDEKSFYAHVVTGFRDSMMKDKPGSWAYTHRAELAKQLQTLALRQNEEISDYNALIAQTGLQPKKASVSALSSAAKSMATTLQDADLNHVPGGHPALLAGVYHLLGQIYDLTGKGIGVPEQPFPVDVSGDLPKKGTQQYATLASIFGWYDQGGILPPGLTLAYNGTGRNEVVSPASPAGTYGPGGLSHGEMQIVNRLDRLISLMSAAPAAYAQTLSGVAGQAAARGYYGG
jgi:cell wall-associated NlpC family hydrolase